MSVGVIFYSRSNIFPASEASQSSLKPGYKIKQLCSGITFATVEMQPHLWDTAGQPIYCQGCAAKQGTKGTESPAGMWKGLDSTSLIIMWPGWQYWCHAVHMCQKIIDSTKKSLLAKRRYLQWHKSPNVGQDPVGLTGSGVLLLISIGVAAVQLCRNSYSEIIWEKTPYCITLLESLHICVGHFQKQGHLGDKQM